MSDTGSTSDPIYCQNCGNDMPPVSEFCDECGVEVGARAAAGTNKKLKASGIISAALSLIFLPIIFGPISIMCGYLLYDRGEGAWGKWIAIGGGVAMVIGFTLSYIIFSAVQAGGGI
jgi:hypothetical protein